MQSIRLKYPKLLDIFSSGDPCEHRFHVSQERSKKLRCLSDEGYFHEEVQRGGWIEQASRFYIVVFNVNVSITIVVIIITEVTGYKL